MDDVLRLSHEVQDQVHGITPPDARWGMIRSGCTHCKEPQECAVAQANRRHNFTFSETDKLWVQRAFTLMRACGTAKYVGSNKAAYDAELFGIAAGLELALDRLPVVTAAGSGIVRVFVDAQSALRRLQDAGPGPGQWIDPRIAPAEQLSLWQAVTETTRDGGKRRRKTNTSIRDLLADERCIEAVMAFLSSTSGGMWPNRA
ncbi:hypothetical protein FN846DRAFT_908369 [Sphaerosporella brunnea]|uniref:Uncharacterized protein n=1 Tax=Sphaerosporella brunnea TaxID=1250544 RepID=A0A5J5ETG7_9PEZI|nr:hypothetical protein FN846DRAFT_908369 [Sphaerosporella brunnea]